MDAKKDGNVETAVTAHNMQHAKKRRQEEPLQAMTSTS